MESLPLWPAFQSKLNDTSVALVQTVAAPIVANPALVWSILIKWMIENHFIEYGSE